MDTGVTTNQLTPTTVVDSIIANRNGSTVLIELIPFMALLAAMLGPTYATRAELFADLNWPAGAPGYVRGDATTAYNGVYKKAGAFGDGSWGRIGDLPSGAIEAAQLAALEDAVELLAPRLSPALTGTPTAPTAVPGTNTTQIATTEFIQAALVALVAAAPGALDTLNELATALGSDPNFATTITALIGAKAPLASPVLTGTPTAPTAPPGTNTPQIATAAFVQAVINDAVAVWHATGGVFIPGRLENVVELSVDLAGRPLSTLDDAGNLRVTTGGVWRRLVDDGTLDAQVAAVTAAQPDKYAAAGVYLPGSSFEPAEVTLAADGRVLAARDQSGLVWEASSGALVLVPVLTDLIVRQVAGGVYVPGMAVEVTGLTLAGDGRVAEVVGQDGRPYQYGAGGWWTQRERQHDYDIVVYGTSLAGIMAVVRAGYRRGKRICVIEPYARLGGMHAAGLVEVDATSASGGETNIMGGDTNNVYFRAILDREVGAAQPITNYAKYRPQPKTCEAVANDLITRYAATVLRDCPLEPADVVTATINGQKQITGLLTRDGLVTGRVYIDASYEGDLMAGALAPAYWTSGREAASEYLEPYAGYLLDNRTVAMGVGSAFPHYSGAATGDALADLLAIGYPINQHSDPGLANGAADPTVQAFNFRLVVTRDGAIRRRFPKPTGYDRSLITTTLQQLRTNGAAGFTTFARFYNNPSIGYQGDIGTNKIGFNSLDLINGQHEYVAGNWAKRREIVAAHVLYQQSMLWGLAFDPVTADFGLSALQTDMVSPADAAGEVGLCADEWQYSEWGPGWPYWLYVREARRLKGAYVLSVWDMTADAVARPSGQTSRTLSKSTSIGKWAYTLDIHQIRGYRMANGGGFYTDRFAVEGTPPHAADQQPIYQIPMEVLFPIKAACSNLLVPWCSSHTHVAWSQARLEIPAGFCGEAAGEIAAWIVDHPTQAVQDISYATLASRLTQFGSKL